MIRSARITTQILTLWAIMCLPVCAAPEEPIARQKAPIAVPAAAILPGPLNVQLWERIPTVIVSLNDSRQERAAIATGMNANVIAPDAALRLKLSPIDGKVKIAALNLSSVAGQAEIKVFRASTLELQSLAVAIADVPQLLTHNSRPDAPATWLGTPFLSAFQLTLDPATKSVTLQKATAPLKRLKQTSVAKLQFRDGRPFVQVTVPGAPPYWALIDTSSPGTMIPTDVAEKLKLKPIKVVPIAWHDGKPGKGAIAIVPQLGVGKADWKSARVLYITPDSSKEYDRNFAVLGMDYLDQYKVTIDFLHSQVAFSPPEKPVAPPSSGDQP